VSIIPDVTAKIAAEVRNFSTSFDVVVTSGGIGSTHDDCTFEASSYPKQPHICDPNVKFFGKNFYCTCEETQLATRLSEFAAKHKENLLIGSYPVTNNRYYKVRISLESQDPRVLEEASEAFAELLSGELVSYDPDPVSNAASRVYELTEQDSDFGRKVASAVRIVEEALQKYGKERVMLSFNGGKDCTALLHILFAVLNKSTLAPSSPSLSRDDSDENEPSASDPVTFSHPRLLYVRARTPFPETEVFVQSVLRYYRYPSAAVKRRFLSCDWFGDFSALSVPLSNDGPNATETSFLLIYEGPIKAGLARLKTDAPDVEAIFMGTRSSDPWAGELASVDASIYGLALYAIRLLLVLPSPPLRRPPKFLRKCVPCFQDRPSLVRVFFLTASTTVMMPTDPDWPPYMRIHPILDWTYTDVWRFIRELSLPYCCLYDCGYTSLGSIEDTHPNPDLRIISPTGLTAYRPAYMLQNPLSERSGRLSSTRKSQSD
ncbi:unnamed protein product, partial [Schistocephalus solidus]|uniref:FAD synthase n=1 Tax=Schistocephalus solidus TaxID=70667 RepID=A0A183T715_SCHSO